MDKTLSVITVTYNSEKNIRKYLQSLLPSLPKNSEVIIVDSGSTDGTIKILEKEKSVHLITSDTNIGFGKGCNLGATHAKGQYLLFLNPDTKVLGKALNILLEYAQSHPNVGIVAPQLIQPDTTPQPSVRKAPTLLGAFHEYYLGQKEQFEAYVPRGNDPVEVETVVGAGMLMRRSLFDEVGGFDEKYFMYFEDLDLCRKVRKKGLKIVYLPEAKIEHEVGASVNPKKLAWLHQSAAKYHGWFMNLLLYMLLRLRPKR